MFDSFAKMFGNFQYKRGVRAPRMDQGRHWRFAARVLQRPATTKELCTMRK